MIELDMAGKKSQKLRPNLERFFEYISAKNEGDTVTDRDLLAATGWEPATLRTHINKNALSPFLARTGAGNYRARRDGSLISRAEVLRAFTQIRNVPFVLSAGARLKGASGDFELLNPVGNGAVANVWRAKRIADGRLFALKVVNPRPDLLDPSTFDNVKHRFSREANNGAAMSHENIVCYVDAGDYLDHPFLVMELADESLATLIEKTPLDVAGSVPIVASCAKGLEHLHSKGCIHRDIKPHNILRFGDRYVLGDLGIVNWSDMNPAFTSAGTITRCARHAIVITCSTPS